MGIRAFQRCKNKHNGKNIVYRLTQEGLQSFFSSFTKRKLKVSIDTLMFLTSNTSIKILDIPESQVELTTIGADEQLGYFAIYVEEHGKVIEMTTLLKFKNSMALMASDETLGGLKIKYNKEFVEADFIQVKKVKEAIEEDK